MGDRELREFVNPVFNIVRSCFRLPASLRRLSFQERKICSTALAVLKSSVTGGTDD